ncbi:MAG: glycosyltransferase family 4 protein [bacterium]
MDKKNVPPIKRILMTADTMGGVWTYALELIKALGEYQIEVNMATMGAPLRRDQRNEVEDIPHLNIFESRYKLEWMDNPWEDVELAGHWLLSLEEAVQPDLIHLNGYVHGALPWKSPALVVGHSCVASWWMAVKGHPMPETWGKYLQEVRCGLRATPLVIAPTRAMLSILEQHYGPLGKTKVIANGRSPSLFRPDKKNPFILSAGRIWDEGKNIMALDRIAPYVPWPVYVAGEGEHPNEKASPSSHVHLLGHLSHHHLSSWLANASIYALPARYEPFGLSALEAALAGCALVLGDIPSFREIWQDAALYVDPGDQEDLITAIHHLIDDKDFRQTMALKARNRGLVFTPKNMARQYLSVYQELAENK